MEDLEIAVKMLTAFKQLKREQPNKVMADVGWMLELLEVVRYYDNVEQRVRKFACDVCRDTPLGYRTDGEHQVTEQLVDRLCDRIMNDPLDTHFSED